jgi:hypothetical protein
MFTFDSATLVAYGFPNPDYFDFQENTIIYGNYGGLDYSAGEIGGTITDTSLETAPTMDNYDKEFYEHDLVAQQTSDPAVLLESHIDVVQDVTTLLYNAFSAPISDWW